MVEYDPKVDFDTQPHYYKRTNIQIQNKPIEYIDEIKLSDEYSVTYSVRADGTIQPYIKYTNYGETPSIMPIFATSAAGLLAIKFRELYKEKNNGNK